METISNNLSAVPTRTDADGTVYPVTGVAQPLTSAPPGAQTPTSSLAGTTFVAEAEYNLAPVNSVGQSELCAQTSTSTVLELQVTVSWGGLNNNRQSVTDSTHIPWDIPQVATEGFISLQLNNDGETDALIPSNNSTERLQAIQVQIQQTSGLNNGATTLTPNPLTVNSDTSGCVFAQVPAGTYSVSVEQPSAASLHDWTGSPPFVDTNFDQSPPAQTVVVNENAVTTVSPVAFDEAIGTTTIAYGSASGIDGTVECPGGAGLGCLVTGNGTSGATASWAANASSWSATTLSSITNLSQVACTSGGSQTCVGVGDSPTAGAIVTTSTDLGTVSADTVPNGVTDVTQVTCPTANGCYALGTTATGPVLLAGAVGQTAPQADVWTEVAPASTTFTSLSSIACPTSTTCEVTGSATVGTTPSAVEILRLDGDPASLASNAAWTPTFTVDNLPNTNGSTTVSSVGEIACPSSTECVALGTGDSTSPTDPTILAATIASSGASTWANEDFPAGTGSITGLSCTSSTCVAIGTMPATAPMSPPSAAVWTGDLTVSPHNWVQAPSGAGGIPSSVLGVTSVACGQPAAGDTADCSITAATGLSAPGQLLEGSLTGGVWAWNFSTAPSGSTVVYYTGVACETPPSAGRATCAAAGATATGPIIVTSSHGPSGTWTTQTPSSLANDASATGTSPLNATVTGVPLELTPADISNWTTPVVAGAASNATSIPTNLYPYAGGYSVAAGDCQAEANSTSIASMTAPPGGTATATVPLGLLPLQVVTASGAPVAGATVVLTSTSCSPTGGDQYTLPVTDADGVTQTSVPFGNYSYSVTVGGRRPPRQPPSRSTPIR